MGGQLYLLTLFAIREEIDKIERGNINEEQEHNRNGIEYGVTANNIKDNIVRSTVTAHKEHVVVVKGHVCYVRGNTEEG